MKTTPDLIIEFSDLSIQWILLKKSPRIEIISFGRKIFTRRTEEEIIPALREIKKSLAKNSCRVSLVIPRREVLQKQMHLHSIDDLELRRMIKLQLPGVMAQDGRDLIFDFSVFVRDPDSGSEVVVTAVNPAVIERYLAYARAAIDVETVTVNSCGLNYWADAAAAKKAGPDDRLLIFRGSDTAQIGFFRRGKCFYSREIEMRNTPEPQSEELIRQLQLIVDGYRIHKLGKGISRVLFIGPAKDYEVLRENWKDSPAGPIEYVDVFPEFRRCDPSAVVPKGDEFTAAILLGTALTAGCPNLVPDRLAKDRQVGNVFSELRKTVLCLGVIVALILGSAFDFSRKQQTLLSNVERQYALTQAEAGGLKEKIERLELIRKQATEPVWIEQLAGEICGLIPDEVAVNVLQIDNQALTIEGLAKDRSTVNEFQEKLAHDHFLKNVTLEYSIQKPVGSGQAVAFKLNGEIHHDVR